MHEDARRHADYFDEEGQARLVVPVAEGVAVRPIARPGWDWEARRCGRRRRRGGGVGFGIVIVKTILLSKAFKAKVEADER